MLFSRKTFSLKESIKNKSGIIAEFKRKSPSKGIINDIENPLSVVCSYENMEQVEFLFLQIQNSSEDQKKIF